MGFSNKESSWFVWLLVLLGCMYASSSEQSDWSLGSKLTCSISFSSASCSGGGSFSEFFRVATGVISSWFFVLTFSMRVPRFVQWSYEIESSCADSSFTTLMSFSLFHFPSAFLQLIIWSIIFASRERSEEFYPFTIIFCSSSLSSHCLSNLKAFFFLVSLDMIMQVPDYDLIPTYGGIVLWNVETFHVNLRSQEHNQDDTEHCRWSFCQPMTIDSMGIQAYHNLISFD